MLKRSTLHTGKLILCPVQSIKTKTNNKQSKIINLNSMTVKPQTQKIRKQNILFDLNLKSHLNFKQYLELYRLNYAINHSKLYIKRLQALFQFSQKNIFNMVVYLEDCRKKYLDQNGNVDWQAVSQKWKEVAKIKVSLANKYFTSDVKLQAQSLPQQKQQSLLDIMMGGLQNSDSSVGAYATTPDDYDTFSFYLEPLIRDYHGIVGDVKQQHDWDIPTGQYLLTKIHPELNNVSMRARVARNVVGWNLPPKMSKDERIRFQQTMVTVFEGFGIQGTYHSLTPEHKNQISQQKANQLIKKHFLFNDMTTDNHLTSSGVASDWPYGRGIWVSSDQTKMIWIGEEDQLRIISIMHGTDLGAVDKSLYELLTKIQGFGLKFAEHPVYGIITTCPTNMGTGKRQSILGKFPVITRKGKNQKRLKQLAKKFGLQARGMGGQHSSMDKYGTADISPSARFGVKQSFVTQKLYKGLVDLFNIEYGFQKGHLNQIVYLQQCRKNYLDEEGKVDWDTVTQRWEELKVKKICLANKYWTPQARAQAEQLNQLDQHRLLDIMMGGLENDDSNVGAYATRPEDYDIFSFYLQPLIREYHGIQGDTKQEHDWNIPLGKYLLTNIDKSLQNVSMRARVARNVVGWNLPPKMSKQERLKFQQTMVQIFNSFAIPGTYHSLTPGHPNQISQQKANELIKRHFLFNDMTTDNHLTSSGVASDWPHGRGIWISKDQTKMIWVGQEDQLRIISIMHGFDLGAVDNSLYQLLQGIQKAGIKFAQHPIYGIITTCPTNMGTGKRQSILGKFPNISNHGKDQKELKQIAKKLGLQARGMGGEHSSMDSEGTADISPTARFGVKQSTVTDRLYSGLVELYGIQLQGGFVQHKIKHVEHQRVQSQNNQPKNAFKASTQHIKTQNQYIQNQKPKQQHNNVSDDYLQVCRLKYLNQGGQVDWQKVADKWKQLSRIKVSLGNKYFTPEVREIANKLPAQDQQRLLDVMMGGLQNSDSSVGVYATRPQDYDSFSFYLQPILKQYHGIQGDQIQQHDWDIPVGKYLLTNINKNLKNVSMRARVARNVVGWNLPPKMTKEQRLKFQNTMVNVFQTFGIQGKYHSLTPGHKNFINQQKANVLIDKHYLFNDMTTDKHLTSSGVASDWPHGRGIWISKDQTKMIWVGQEDQLRIISIVKGHDLGAVDNSLYQLLSSIQKAGLKFAQHPIYGVITTCPTNMGTGKRQSILGKFPNISNHGKDQKKLKQLAKTFGLQARGMGGEHSSMDSQGTADISPSARFGVTQAFVTQKLYNGLVKLYEIELNKKQEQEASCKLI